jgi:hypothetical protein
LSFYVFKPDSSSLGDFEVWAAAFWALDVGVCDFWDEVYGFCGFFIEVLFFEEPGVSAGSAFQRCFRSGYVEFCVLEVGWFEL